MKTLAILVAAGRGERLGADRPKAFLSLKGRTLLQRSAQAFERSPSIDGIVAVVPRGLESEAREQLAAVARMRAVVTGGMRRQDSVRAGLRQAPSGFDGVILVHDAARPFVSTQIIEAVAAAAGEVGAALPVLPLVDTVKRVRDGRVVETLDRDELAAAQTPQGFRMAVLVSAYEKASEGGVTVTDEAMAVERMAGTVVTVAGSAENRKITTPEDWKWAEGHVAVEEAAE